MPRAKHSRKQLFRAALAMAGLTAEQWAASEGITAGHLSQVVTGKRESVTLTAKVDEFVRDEFAKRPALVA